MQTLPLPLNTRLEQSLRTFSLWLSCSPALSLSVSWPLPRHQWCGQQRAVSIGDQSAPPIRPTTATVDAAGQTERQRSMVDSLSNPNPEPLILRLQEQNRSRLSVNVIRAIQMEFKLGHSYFFKNNRYGVS